jgi:DNA polymerase-3 subunit delta
MAVVACADILFGDQSAQQPGIIAVFGGDAFLTTLTRNRIRDWAVGPDPDDFTFAMYTGEDAKLSDVLDDLHTPPFIGDRRLVVVESADGFVTSHRSALEDFAQNLSECGILLLEVKTWNKATKLAKLVEANGLAVEAKSPDKPKAAETWCVNWARRQYGKKLSPPVAAMLVEQVGMQLGQLDQELCKLANFVGVATEIDLNAVQTMVVGVHSEETFKLLGYALEGQLPRALDQLERMLASGVAPQMIVGTLITQLRKLTRAARLVVSGHSMRSALDDSGFRHPFAQKKGEQQLRAMGRERMAEMYRRLLQLDYNVKGGSSLSYQALIERFLIELAAPKARPGAAR